MRFDLQYEYDDGEYFIEGTTYLVYPDLMIDMIPYFITVDNGESYELILASSEHTAVQKFFHLVESRQWVRMVSDVGRPQAGAVGEFYKIGNTIRYVKKSLVCVEEADPFYLRYSHPLMPEQHSTETLVASDIAGLLAEEHRGQFIKQREQKLDLFVRGKEVRVSLIPDGFSHNTLNRGDLVKWKPLQSSSSASRKHSLGRVIGVVDVKGMEEKDYRLLKEWYLPNSFFGYDNPVLVAFMEDSEKVSLDFVCSYELSHYDNADILLWFLNYDQDFTRIAKLASVVPLDIDAVAALTNTDGSLYDAKPGTTHDELVAVAEKINKQRLMAGIYWSPPGKSTPAPEVGKTKTETRTRAFVDMMQEED